MRLSTGMTYHFQHIIPRYFIRASLVKDGQWWQAENDSDATQWSVCEQEAEGVVVVKADCYDPETAQVLCDALNQKEQNQ